MENRAGGEGRCDFDSNPASVQEVDDWVGHAVPHVRS